MAGPTQTVSTMGKLKCNIPLRLDTGQQVIRTKALIDSGNKVRYPLIISGRVAEKLKLKISAPPLGLKVGTASTEGTLKIVGVGSPVTVRIPDHQNSFKMKPLVIQDLSHPVNLGSVFLNKAKLMLDFSGTTPRVVEPGGKSTQMICQLKEDLVGPQPQPKDSYKLNDNVKGGAYRGQLKSKGPMVQGSQDGSGKPRVELRKGGKEYSKKIVSENPTYIRSLEDNWIQPGATIRIAVTAPRDQ